MKKIAQTLLLFLTIVVAQAQTATVVLNVPEIIWETNPGYQLLLDATATQTDAYLNVGLMECGTSYANWSHTIPENATASDEHVVALTQASISIPAGTYDYLVVNPNCENAGVIGISTDQCDPARGNNFTFEGGKMYTFTLSKTFNPIYFAETDCVTLTIADNPVNGIAAVEKNDYPIYPNPATHQITIMGENIVFVEIINLLGKNVLTTTSTQIATNNLQKGTYFVRLHLQDGSQITKKIFKQ